MITNCIEKIALYENSFYVYEESVIRKQIEKLKNSFEGIDFLYSVKCNPNTNVLDIIFGSGFGADAASLNEVKMSYEHGVDKSKIYYSAPGKSERDIFEALDYSIIIADSLNEIRKISSVAGNKIVNIGIRINPDFTLENEQGIANKFGIDEKDVIEIIHNGLPENIRISGIHVHVKSQVLEQDKLRDNYGRIISLAERIEKELGYGLDFINMGSGIGVAYSLNDCEIDVERLGNEAMTMLANFRKSHLNTKLFIETGRFVVCKSGTYITHVVDKKNSYGKTFVILQNTLNGFIRPSMVRMVASYAGEGCTKSCEPMYTSFDSFTIKPVRASNEFETVTMVGNLCTGADVIAENISMPKMEIGDLVEINNAGAYSYVLSPMQFSSQGIIKEFVVTEEGEIL